MPIIGLRNYKYRLKRTSFGVYIFNDVFLKKNMNVPNDKKSKFYAIVNMRCPNCYEGNLFINANAYNLKTISDMPERCSHCNFKYEIETGFFYGAMYVSYAITVALAMGFIMFSFIFDVKNIEQVIFIFALLVLAFFPLVFRLSRSIWLHMFVKFGSR
jgi:uncharacterized protein (DUF983 family)